MLFHRGFLCVVYMAEINRIEVQKLIDEMFDSVHACSPFCRSSSAVPCLQGFFLYMPILADKREDYVPDKNKK